MRSITRSLSRLMKKMPPMPSFKKVLALQTAAKQPIPDKNLKGKANVAMPNSHVKGIPSFMAEILDELESLNQNKLETNPNVWVTWDEISNTLTCTIPLNGVPVTVIIEMLQAEVYEILYETSCTQVTVNLNHLVFQPSSTRQNEMQNSNLAKQNAEMLYLQKATSTQVEKLIFQQKSNQESMQNSTVGFQQADELSSYQANTLNDSDVQTKLQLEKELRNELELHAFREIRLKFEKYQEEQRQLNTQTSGNDNVFAVYLKKELESFLVKKINAEKSLQTEYLKHAKHVLEQAKAVIELHEPGQAISNEELRLEMLTADQFLKKQKELIQLLEDQHLCLMKAFQIEEMQTCVSKGNKALEEEKLSTVTVNLNHLVLQPSSTSQNEMQSSNLAKQNAEMLYVQKATSTQVEKLIFQQKSNQESMQNSTVGFQQAEELSSYQANASNHFDVQRKLQLEKQQRNELELRAFREMRLKFEKYQEEQRQLNTQTSGNDNVFAVYLKKELESFLVKKINAEKSLQTKYLKHAKHVLEQAKAVIELHEPGQAINNEELRLEMLTADQFLKKQKKLIQLLEDQHLCLMKAFRIEEMQTCVSKANKALEEELSTVSETVKHINHDELFSAVNKSSASIKKPNEENLLTAASTQIATLNKTEITANAKLENFLFKQIIAEKTCLLKCRKHAEHLIKIAEKVPPCDYLSKKYEGFIMEMVRANESLLKLKESIERLEIQHKIVLQALKNEKSQSSFSEANEVLEVGQSPSQASALPSPMSTHSEPHSALISQTYIDSETHNSISH